MKKPGNFVNRGEWLGNYDTAFRNDAPKPRRRRCWRGAIPLLCLGGWLLPWVFGGVLQAQDANGNLSDLDIERLLNIEVISAAKHKEPLFHTASAIFVLTGEDIQRSGATNIPDLLRMVPGLSVAQVNASGWAISSRGFGERYSNKLLVLVDGRTVYDPLFSGVYWDAQNLDLEDIERIEVIRGPGATLWGANAVNGVINILTRSSRDTQGTLLTTTVGTIEPVHISLRYGDRWGSSGTYRVYGTYFRRDHSEDTQGGGIFDGWEAGGGGFRADWSLSSADAITLLGDVRARGADETTVLPSLTPPYRQTSVARKQHWGENVLVRWNHSLTNGQGWTLQTYYDHLHRQTQTVDEHLHTLDVDFHHHLHLSQRHDWIWGIGYRAIFEDIGGSFLFRVLSDTEQLFSTFLQDEVALIPNHLRLIPGVKLERNSHSGWGWQPSLRVLWIPNSRSTVWAAVSQALRNPSDVEEESRINFAVLPQPSGPVQLVSVFGNDDFQPEKLVAYELGYRWSPGRRVSLDVASFYNVYHDLETLEPAAPYLEAVPAPEHLVLPQRFENGLHGETYGVELSSNWSITGYWQLSAAYSRLVTQLHRKPQSQYFPAELAEKASPGHQFQLRSHLVISSRLELDTSWQYVSSLDSLSVPAYSRLDSQLTWHAGEFTSFSAGGQNLLTPQHLEFGDYRQVGVIGQSQRNLYLRLLCRF